MGSLSNSVGEKTNNFSSNSSAFRWSYFVANKLLLIKILALK